MIGDPQRDKKYPDGESYGYWMDDRLKGKPTVASIDKGGVIEKVWPADPNWLSTGFWADPRKNLEALPPPRH